MEIKFLTAQNAYLDHLVTTYPMNDYKRKPRKQKKPIKRVLWDAFLYTVGSIIITTTMLVIACADSIMAGI